MKLKETASPARYRNRRGRLYLGTIRFCRSTTIKVTRPQEINRRSTSSEAARDQETDFSPSRELKKPNRNARNIARFSALHKPRSNGPPKRQITPTRPRLAKAVRKSIAIQLRYRRMNREMGPPNNQPSEIF